MSDFSDKNIFLELIKSKTAASIAGIFSDGIRPIPRITVSEWADKYRKLSSKSSSEFGQYRTSRVPYTREIADNLGKTSDVWRVIVMKGAQLGLTELGNNWIGYIMHMNPGPVIMAMPTEAAVKKNSTTRITPMIDSTPELKALIKQAGTKDAGNTVMQKDFKGGVLFMIGVNSPVGLASTPAGFIYMDEANRFPHSAGSEGSPVALLEARALTFSNKKILMTSTPTIVGEDVVYVEFLKGDQRYYNVECQGCKDLFVLNFDYLTWEPEKPETTRMACPNCGFLHEERHKTKMMAELNYGGQARWVPTATPSDKLIRSYHLSGLYSPAGWLSWEQVVRKYLDINGDENLQKVFDNTILGKSYAIKSDAPDSENLYNRRENYEVGTVPKGVYFLTMGVDVQKDRIEGEVVGWGKGRESWSVEYFVLLGDPAKSEVWDQLTEIINRQYEVGDVMMSIGMTCIDAGHLTSSVYDFTSKFSVSRVRSVMGRGSTKDVMVSPPKTYNLNKSGKKITNAKVWYLGVSLLKTELYGFLKLKAKESECGTYDIYPAGYCHFPMYDRHYFNMLTAEQEVLTINKRGFKEYTWESGGRRNEALDIRNYARAGAYMLGIDRFKDNNWNSIKNQFCTEKVIEKTIVPEKKTIKKSSYWDR